MLFWGRVSLTNSLKANFTCDNIFKSTLNVSLNNFKIKELDYMFFKLRTEWVFEANVVQSLHFMDGETKAWKNYMSCHIAI